MKMWFLWLMVTSLTNAVFADAGYLYDTPSTTINSPSNLPPNSYPSYEFQRYYYNKGEEGRNVYLNKQHVNNIPGYGLQGGNLEPQSLQNYATSHSNSGYAGNMQVYNPSINYNNNFGQSNWQPQVPSLSDSARPGWQTPQLYIKSNQNLNYFLPSSNQNFGYGQMLLAPNVNNYNNGFSQSQAPLTPAVHQYTYSQPFTAIGENNLNNLVNTATYNSIHSNSFNHNSKHISSLASNNEYNKGAQISGSLNNVHGQTTNLLMGANSNSGYTHNYTPSLPADSNNGFAHTTLSSSSIPVQQQFITSTGSSNSNPGYEQSSTLSSGVNGFVANKISNTGVSSINDYAQTHRGPIHIDLSSDLKVTAGTDNLQNGLVRQSLEKVVSTSTNTIHSSHSVTPIVHKHIYFHVPPPEIEEPEKATPLHLQPKKNFKILFIKVPSQESKSNIARLQEQVRSTAVEDRTLIYLLVKKPDDPKPLVLPQPKPSEHQVFFVKYNDNPFDIAARVSDELDKTGSINSIVPIEPGLPNGYHK